MDSAEDDRECAARFERVEEFEPGHRVASGVSGPSGTMSVIRVPLPGSDSMRSSPLISSERSRMFCKPRLERLSYEPMT